jgi:hypothetical protein
LITDGPFALTTPVAVRDKSNATRRIKDSLSRRLPEMQQGLRIVENRSYEPTAVVERENEE